MSLFYLVFLVSLKLILRLPGSSDCWVLKLCDLVINSPCMRSEEKLGFNAKLLSSRIAPLDLFTIFGGQEEASSPSSLLVFAFF